MPTRKERFKKWRGDLARDEQHIFDTTLLIEQYFSQVSNLTDIKRDFNHFNSDYYLRLNDHNSRSKGALVYCRLIIEETLDLLPGSAFKAREILFELKSILSHIFDNPFHDAENNAKCLMNGIKELLLKRQELFPDINQVVHLYWTFYLVLRLVYLGIKHLNDLTRFTLKSLVNIEVIQKEIIYLLEVMDKNAEFFNKDLEVSSSCSSETTMTSRALHYYFKERFLKTYQEQGNEMNKCLRMKVALNRTSEDLTLLILLRHRQQKIMFHRQKIQELLETVIDNDLQHTNKMQFLDVIQKDSALFNVLMEYSLGTKKNQLLEKMNQLHSLEMTQEQSETKISSGIGWAWTFVTSSFYSNPSTSNALIKNALELECKELLKKIASESQNSLNSLCEHVEKEIQDITKHLSNADEALKKKIETESIQGLYNLLKINQAQEKALNTYTEITLMIKNNAEILASFKEMHSVFTDFTLEHDNWLVKLSNFFAQFCSFFKSETADLVDKSYEFMVQLSHLEASYHDEMIKGLNTIQNHPDLSAMIKQNFKSEFETISYVKATDSITHVSVSKQEVRDMMKKACLFFKKMNVPEHVVECTQESEVPELLIA